MDLSGPSIDVKLKEKEKERSFLLYQSFFKGNVEYSTGRDH
jgi:hypothetical protein